jgi:signal transduction histidine kinase
MKRFALLWLVFGICVAVLLGAMAWISYTVVRLERAEREARRTAVVEENIRLALWRMDSLVAPVVAQEMARPYWTYAAFAPVEGVYGKMFNEIPRGEVLAPSPLLSAQSPLVLLHCELRDDGFSCPQAPTGNMRDLATRYTTRERIAEAEAKLGRLRELLSKPEVLAALPRETMETTWVTNTMVVPESLQVEEQQQQQQEIQIANDLAQSPRMQQQARNTIESRARSRFSKSASNYDYLNNRANAPAQDIDAPAPEVKEGVMKPLWVDGELILARRVMVNGQQRVQGCWMNWSELEKTLLDNARDLLPAATLAKVTAAAEEDEKAARRLAAIPVRLVPGAVPVSLDHASPVRLTLTVAWTCALLGAAAVALLLWGAISLSERRGAFVSAVTHELRTPLTTVSMYAEMLEEGMVTDERKRKHYLGTLRAEAERLGHLVENVLAYSRIERGKISNRIQPVTVGELVESTRQRLANRAEQAGMSLEVDLAQVRDASVLADPSAVEQILFNLVDNAGKYARTATDKRLHIEGREDGPIVSILVRDHGPGISATDARKLFRPFSKSARDAANSAPGVGLGLALSRRLAREMKGELRLRSDQTEGAAFVLTLRRT